MTAPWINISFHGDRATAELIAGRLQDGGIPAGVTGNGILPGFGTSFAVCVPPESLERARALLADDVVDDEALAAAAIAAAPATAAAIAAQPMQPAPTPAARPAIALVAAAWLLPFLLGMYFIWHAVLGALPEEHRPAPLPEVLAGAVFQPQFVIGDVRVDAGKMFLVEDDACGGRVLVSALHLLGPSGGYARQLTPGEVDAEVRWIILNDVRRSHFITDFQATSLTPADAAPCCEKAGARAGAGDIIAFRAPPELAGPALHRASKPVQPGDVLYLVSTGYRGEQGAVLHAATAGRMEDGLLFFEYDEAELALQATSGAPVVDADGNVVGINIDGRHSEDGRTLYGVANGTSAWWPALVATCRERPVQRSG